MEQKVTLHFKSNKEIQIAEDAKAPFEQAGWKYTPKGWKRPSMDVICPALASSDVISILENGGAGEQFLLAVLNDQFPAGIRQSMADIIADNPLATVTQETINGFNLSWESMAANYLTALQETRSTGIPKETWDDFEADYVAVMLQQMPQKGEDKIKNAAAHLKNRFGKCRSNKNMVKALQNYLSVWYAATTNQEDLARVFETLNARADVLLAASDEDSI